MRPLLVELRVRVFEELVDAGPRLNVRAVIDEVSNRHACRELGEATHVIAVPVGRDEVIDLRDARIARGGHDAAGVARRRRSPVPRVDEQRFAGGRHEQRRVPALDVDDVDVQGLPGATLAGGENRREAQERERRQD